MVSCSPILPLLKDLTHMAITYNHSSLHMAYCRHIQKYKMLLFSCNFLVSLSTENLISSLSHYTVLWILCLCLHILYILCCSLEWVMSTHAAGEGGNSLQRGVGSPIHTPTLGGGDCHTFIPFTSPFLCMPLCLPPWFSPPRLIRIEMEQWVCLGG